MFFLYNQLREKLINYTNNKLKQPKKNNMWTILITN